MVDANGKLTICSLTHDIARRRSYVGFVWDTDAEKRLSLQVPYGCSLNAVADEAMKAVRELAVELNGISVVTA
jgi:hypothetical protein